MNKKIDVVVVGGVSYDYIENPFGGSAWTPGGAGAYGALAAYHMGCTVGLVGLISSTLPKKTRAILESFVDTTGILDISSEDITFVIKYNESWKATYVRSGHTSEYLVDFQAIPKLYYDARLFHITPTFSTQRQLGIVTGIKAMTNSLVSATTSQYYIESDKDNAKKLMRTVDIFFLNLEEAELITNKKKIDAIVRTLFSIAPSTIICVTDGPNGVLILVQGTLKKLKAFREAVCVDPTGAGETFAGAFCANYITSNNAVTAGAMATSLASFTIEGWGLNPLLRPKIDIAGRIITHK